MGEQIVLPLGALLALVGMALAGLSWLWNLHGRVGLLEQRVTHSTDSTATKLAALDVEVKALRSNGHDQNNKSMQLAGRCDLLDQQLRTFSHQYRSDLQRTMHDIDIAGRLSAIERGSGPGKVIALRDALQPGEDRDRDDYRGR